MPKKTDVVCHLNDDQLKRVLSSRRFSEPPQIIDEFSLVDWGGHRYVYAFGDCVVKVTVRQDGKNHLHNQDECETWQKAPKDLKNVLAPVLEHAEDFSWLTMPKAKTIHTGLDPKTAEDALKDVSDVLRSGSYSCFDVKKSSIGILNGKPVLVDYGFGVQGGTTDFLDACHL